MFPAVQWKIWTKNALLVWTAYKVDKFGQRWRRIYHTAVKRLSMHEKLQEHRTAFVLGLGKYQISVA